jgi:catechol 2,3-dioxygenase-like lactoylglutathione lyase family enzyme
MPALELDRSVSFYQQVLGEQGMRISPGRHYFMCGGVILAVYNPKADGDSTEPRPNFDHVYFAVADLESFYQRAEQAGGLSTVIGDGDQPMGKIARRPWGERSFYMKDPSGNPICFVDEATLFRPQ